MIVHFNFTSQEIKHQVRLKLTDSLSEKMVSIEGRNYKILGSQEDVSLLKRYLASLESNDFDSLSSFQASLKGLGPYEKTHSVFQETFAVDSKIKIEKEHLASIELLKKVKESLPPSAGAMVVVYEEGKGQPPICIGQTSVNATKKHYTILLRDIQKQLRKLEAQEKELGPNKTRQAKIKELSEKIALFKKEISAQEAAQPVNMQTATLIGSGAKMFTALLSQVLCEKDYLSLKTKLSDVLSEEQFQIFEDPESAKNITLEMLLSHTSGLQYYADDSKDSRKGQSLDEILKGMKPHGIRFIASPGDGVYSYSNQIELAAVFIEKAYEKKMEPKRQELRQKIEKAEKHVADLKNKRDHVGEGSSGRSKKISLDTQIAAHEERLKQLKSDLDNIPSNYADIMKAELLDPLGMTRTSFDKPKDDNVLRAYRDGSSFDVEILDPLMRGAGALWSCMGDMTKLVEAYTENGLKTPSGDTLISAERLQDMAHVRGINGDTGLGLNVDGSVIGKGGSIASYEFTLRMDPSKGNAVISMCNFNNDRAHFNSFAKNVKEALDVMYPEREPQIPQMPLREKEPILPKEDFPMAKCDSFFKGDRGFVGLKQVKEEPGILLNWNGQTLPLIKLGENRYLILDSGYPGGQVLQILTGRQTGKIYVIIGKEGETNAFQEIARSEMFFPKNTDSLKEISQAKGTYVSTIKGGPTFQFNMDERQNCQLAIEGFPPVPALVTKVVEGKDGRTDEVFLQGNCGPFPPDKLFKISRGDVVREEMLKELVEKKSTLEIVKKQGPSEKQASLEKQIEDLQKQLTAQKEVAWFFRVADFVNPDNINEAIPLTSPLQPTTIGEKRKPEDRDLSTWTQRDLKLLPSRRRLVAEKCWDVYVTNAEKTKEKGRNYNGLKNFLINTSPHSQEAQKRFEEAIREKDFDIFVSLFDHLSTNQVHRVNDSEDLDAIPSGKVRQDIRLITKEDLENLKKYMEETGFSGIVTISDGQSVHTIRSKKFESLPEDRIPFSIHSVGKVFTGALVLLMTKDNVITPDILNNPPLEIDPRIKKKLPLNVQKHLSNISLGQAMTHQGMLGDYLGDYEKTIEIALKEGVSPPAINRAEDLIAFSDDQIKKNDYSNLGLLLTGLSIQYHYNKKHGTSLTYDQILKTQILDPIGINLATKKPKNAHYNEEDPIAPHIEGGPAGGYWTTSEDLHKFGRWLNNQCKDPEFCESCEKFGSEFYSEKRREISHSGFISSASAHLSSFLDNGITISVMSDEGQLAAPRLRGAIIENILEE
jgi:CubicO group peptidase (beta-lactamase class C family)